MEKCKICGARLNDGTTVCPSCGANVADGIAGQGTATSASLIRTTCPSCGAEVIGEHRFCDKCGANLKEAVEQNTPVPRERRCPSCGSILQTNSAFCPDCGANLSGNKPSTAPSPQAATTTSTSSPAPATAPSRKVGITLTPTSLCESPEFFPTVQDLVNSKLMQNKGGDWMLEVEGELTEDEMIFLCNTVIIPGRAIKSLDLSKCSTAYLLKDTQGSDDYILTRCKALETIKLPNKTIERNDSSTNSQNMKAEEERLIAAFITGEIHGDSSSNACRHYKKAFRKFQEDGGLSYNCATFAFGFLHLLYRKSILGAVLAFFASWILIPAVLNILLGIQLPEALVGYIAQLIFGFAGDRFIYSRYQKLCARARVLYPSDEEARIELVARNGGPSIKTLLLGAGIFAFIIAVIYIAAQ